MIRHHPTHWIAVAAVAALALIAFEASGADAPSLGSDAVFQGRPALAGAQGGLGAQAGMPQGGLAVESSSDMAMNLRPPRIILEQREVQQGQGRIVERVVEVARVDPVIAAANTDMVLLPGRARATR